MAVFATVVAVEVVVEEDVPEVAGVVVQALAEAAWKATTCLYQMTEELMTSSLVRA